VQATAVIEACVINEKAPPYRDGFHKSKPSRGDSTAGDHMACGLPNSLKERDATERGQAG